MYWSPALVVLVPPGVVTVTSTVPTVPAGAVAVMVVALLTVKARRRGAEVDGGGAGEVRCR